jgi:hypothetical protein
MKSGQPPSNIEITEQVEARAQALELLNMEPWGKKPAGLAVPVPVRGKPFEDVLVEHRGGGNK